jgi:hypothetical protein
MTVSARRANASADDRAAALPCGLSTTTSPATTARSQTDRPSAAFGTTQGTTPRRLGGQLRVRRRTARAARLPPGGCSPRPRHRRARRRRARSCWRLTGVVTVNLRGPPRARGSRMRSSGSGAARPPARCCHQGGGVRRAARRPSMASTHRGHGRARTERVPARTVMHPSTAAPGSSGWKRPILVCGTRAAGRVLDEADAPSAEAPNLTAGVMWPSIVLRSTPPGRCSRKRVNHALRRGKTTETRRRPWRRRSRP